MNNTQKKYLEFFEREWDLYSAIQLLAKFGVVKDNDLEAIVDSRIVNEQDERHRMCFEVGDIIVDEILYSKRLNPNVYGNASHLDVLSHSIETIEKIKKALEASKAIVKDIEQYPVKTKNGEFPVKEYLLEKVSEVIERDPQKYATFSDKRIANYAKTLAKKI